MATAHSVGRTPSGGQSDLRSRYLRVGYLERVYTHGAEAGDLGAGRKPAAVLGGALADLWERAGLEGKTVIDATNRLGVEPPPGCASNAEYVKSKTHGPTAKSFNLNFARLYPRLGEARVKPSNLWSGDDEARPIVEQLIRDAGYEPVRVGGLEMAAAQEAMIQVNIAIMRDSGPFLCRMASPDQL